MGSMVNTKEVKTIMIQMQLKLSNSCIPDGSRTIVHTSHIVSKPLELGDNVNPLYVNNLKK